jgi:transglutaminase-like putative cysteine protease
VTRPAVPLPLRLPGARLLARLRAPRLAGQAVPTAVGAMATLLCAMALQPLFRGFWWWFAPVVLTITVVVGLAALGRALGLPPVAALLLSLLGLLLTLTVVCARSEAFAGIVPTPASCRHLDDLISAGRDEMSRLAAPVPHLPGLVMVTLIGVALVALFVDLLVVTVGRPILAGLPLLGLFAVPAAVLPHGVGPGPFAVGVLGFLALLLLDGRAVVAGWGRLVTGPGHNPNRVWLGGPAGRVALGAVVLAVVVPLVVPSLDGHGLVHRSTAGTGDTGPRDSRSTLSNSPMSTLEQRLHVDPNQPVMTVRPQVLLGNLRLRYAALEAFNGVAFDVPGDGEPHEISAGADAQAVNRHLPGPPAGLTITRVAASISVNPTFKEPFLPLPGIPTSISGLTGDWRLDEEAGTVFANHTTAAGATYQVVAADPNPTRAQLTATGTVPADLAYDTRLPADLDPRIRQLAATIAAGQTTAFDEVQAIQDFFRGGLFRYDLNGAPTDPATALSTFLFGSRTGYCEQFASAMAVLVRELGIPARVAVGFVDGTAEPDGSILIKNGDAHAWPEVWLPGTGWVAFEPTPRSDGGTPPPSYAPGAAGARVPAAGLTSQPTDTSQAPGSGPGAVVTTSPAAQQTPATRTGSAGATSSPASQAPMDPTVGHASTDLMRTFEGSDLSVPALSIRTSDPGAFRNVFLRESAEDTFDGTNFVPSPLPADGDQPLGAGLPHPAVPLPTTSLTATISVNPDFHETELPVPDGTPTSVTGLLGGWQVNTPTGTIYATTGTSAAGAVYTVTAGIPQPTPAQLRASGPTPAALAIDRALPASIDPRIAQLAAGLTAGRASAYDKAAAMDAYLHGSQFSYDIAVAPGTVSNFLFNLRSGICTDYATAMAVLLRSIGIPARVAIGYATPTTQPDGTLLYKSGDRHAWTEVWLPGTGWYAFNPTSSHGAPPNVGTNTWSPRPGQKQTETGHAGAGGMTGASGASGQRAGGLGSAGRTALWVLLWVLVGLAGLALLAGPAIARLVIRRQRLRGGRSRAAGTVTAGGGTADTDARVTNARVRAGWAELLDVATDLGIALRPSDSPRMVVDRLNSYLTAGPEADDERVVAAAAALARLSWAEERVRYAPPGTTLGAGAQKTVPADVATAVGALLAVAPRSRRLMAQVAPPSVLHRLTRYGGYAADERAWQRRAAAEAAQRSEPGVPEQPPAAEATGPAGG